LTIEIATEKYFVVKKNPNTGGGKVLSKYRGVKLDGFVKRLKTSFGVIPAKAGIQCFQILLEAAFAGMTEFQLFYEFIKLELRIYDNIVEKSIRRMALDK
jgi:hypothetical protein